MTSVAQLLETLRRLHLLDSAQLASLTGPGPDPRALARALVQRGLPTLFQANQLFTGRGQNPPFGSYVLRVLFGGGGMGAVYKARNWKLGHVVALKLIRR